MCTILSLISYIYKTLQLRELKELAKGHSTSK